MTRPPFVILTRPRSGSYHLVSLLGSAPDLVCYGEVYKRERVELPPPVRACLGLRPGDMAARDKAGAGLLSTLAALSPECAVGFKAFPSQLRGLTHRSALLFGPDWRRIVLRRNPLATYLSALRAHATGIWAVRAGETPPADALRAPVRFDPAEFAQHLEGAARFDRLCDAIAAAAPDAVLRADYRDLNDPGALARALAFLGSAATPDTLRSDRLRQFPAPPEDGVENAGEMRRHLDARGLGALLDAG
jgi:hypothetical protein